MSQISDDVKTLRMKAASKDIRNMWVERDLLEKVAEIFTTELRVTTTLHFVKAFKDVITKFYILLIEVEITV
ncbi:CLUMA_CG006095, isoform A [Clunio marinus]|uniref:CLUMA_CG006095, isoform A n=1 Tax=Clunio marinus TaxID=568069 RepID=A0A1J1HWZ0_9DIPT|nr:CLUMA_CG006095, isoform A [Clunio marinus]